jgi:hypothetical protein
MLLQLNYGYNNWLISSCGSYFLRDVLFKIYGGDCFIFGDKETVFKLFQY